MSGAVIIIITPPPPPPTKPSGLQQQRAGDTRLAKCLGHGISIEGSPSRWVRFKSGVALIAEALRR